MRARNRLIDKKSDKQVDYCIQLLSTRTYYNALDTLRSTVFYHFLTNRLFGEKGRDLLSFAGLCNIDKKYYDGTKDICNVLIDVENIENEFNALNKIKKLPVEKKVRPSRQQYDNTFH